MSDHDIVHLSAIDWSIVDSLQNKPSRQAFDESINQFKSINQHTINVAFKLWEYKQYPTIKAIEQLTTSVNQLLNQSGKNVYENDYLIQSDACIFDFAVHSTVLVRI